MRSIVRRAAIFVFIAGLAGITALNATTLVRMNLGDLCGRAETIFRGKVLDVVPGSVEVGGGQLPTMTYRVLVDEAFKGDFEMVKGQRIAEIRMVGKVDPVEVNGARRLPVLNDLPTIRIGESYLLFTTQPSAIGLATTVGLGQGSFHISGKGQKMQAVNEFDNVGLFSGTEAAGTPARGPVSYSDLADRIRAELGRD